MHRDSSPSSSTVSGGAPRAVRPRTHLNGRAALGALLVAAAVVGVFAAHAGSEEGPTGRAVVATATTAIGGTLDAGHLDVVELDLPPETAEQTFSRLAEVDGAIALAPLAPGDLVQRSAVLPADGADGAGEVAPRELSIAVERDRAVGGALRPGERVDVLATYGSGPDAYTAVAARSALVRRAQEAAGAGLSSSGTVAVTLGLASAEEVMRLAHAREVAALALVRTTRAGDRPTGPDTYRAVPPR